jgi:hypothetical protein
MNGLNLSTAVLLPYTRALSGLGVPGRRYSLGEFHRGFSLSETGNFRAFN